MLVVEIENDNLMIKDGEHTFFLMRCTYSGKSRKLTPCGDPSSFCKFLRQKVGHRAVRNAVLFKLLGLTMGVMGRPHSLGEH